MSQILFATVPVLGHINPILPLARALVARGHDVRWYSGRKHAARIAATGARFVAFTQARDYDDLHFEREFPGRSALQGLDQLRFDLMRVFMDAAPGQFADIEAITEAWRPDAIVADPTMFGAGFAHERLGIPLAIVSVLPCVLRSRDTAPFGLGLAPMASTIGRARNALLNQLVERVVFRGVQAHWQQARARTARPRRVSVRRTTPRFALPVADRPRLRVPALGHASQRRVHRHPARRCAAGRGAAWLVQRARRLAPGGARVARHGCQCQT